MTMGAHVLRNSLSALMLAFVCSSAAMAQESGNAERLVAAIRTALPGAQVTVPDPNSLDIIFEGQARAVGIGSVNAACAQGTASCDAAIHSYAQRATSYMLEAVPVKRDQLRIVVRSRSYLESMISQIPSPSDFVVEPLIGNLVSICYRDLPSGRRPIIPQDLSTLQLDKPSALSLCKKNSHLALAPLEKQWNALPQQGIGYLQTGEDVTGYLAAPEEWRPLAERLGSLIVAMPSIDTLLYARGSKQDVDALATLAEQMRARASAPVSAQVLRWTDHGWVPVDTH
jgi:hypothetical protein